MILLLLLFIKYFASVQNKKILLKYIESIYLIKNKYKIERNGRELLDNVSIAGSLLLVQFNINMIRF